MSKKHQNPSAKIFNINKEADKHYPADRSISSSRGIPEYHRVKLHIPGTLKCVTVNTYRAVAA
jgi:hypothetical protein